MTCKWIVLLAVVGLLSTSLVQCQEDQDDLDLADIADMPDEEPPVVDEDEEAKLEFKQRPTYKKPVASGTTYFTESFDSEEDFKKIWIVSQTRKDDAEEDVAKYDGKWSMEEATNNPVLGDLGLALKSRAKHHAISAKLTKPYEFTGNPFVVQYEVKFQNGQDCGGAYIKLLTEDSKLKLNNFMDKSPYTIMFGPDKCGNDNKLHFIFRHKSPITGKFEEKHAKKPTSKLDTHFSDKRSHLYTLVVHPDNRFEVFIDQELVNSGSLLEDVEPPVNPPKEIIDASDKKPDGWDEREKIPDPDATKPDDWDESEPEMIPDAAAIKPEGWLDSEPDLIPDPDAERPIDWDEDMDGEWEPPMISNPICESAPGCGEWNAPQKKNPKYKGKWRPSMIENPDYKGKWKPNKIANPDFFEDPQPYNMEPIGAVGLELWSMSDDILFDNFIITDDKAVADQWATDTWEIKHMQELAGDGSGRSVVDAVMDATKERPWLWAVLIIVVILPIVLVIAYCCMPGSSKASNGFFSYLMVVAEERKWLYGVYVAIVLLPIAILSVWLCPNSGPLKPADIAAHRKKTDQPTEDDKEEDDVDSTEQEAPPAKASGDTPKPAKPSKTVLESEQAEADAEDAEDEEGGEEEAGNTRSSPRKRKTRARKD